GEGACVWRRGQVPGVGGGRVVRSRPAVSLAGAESFARDTACAKRILHGLPRTAHLRFLGERRGGNVAKHPRHRISNYPLFLTTAHGCGGIDSELPSR